MQTAPGYTIHTADVRGTRFHFLEWGSPHSPPLVLLHGLTGHAHIWDHMAPALARSYHLLAPDQRGHGDTEHTVSYTTSDFVGDLEAMRVLWGLDRFALMGLSMGGHNAIAYADAHPDRLTHLVVIDIPPRLDPRTWPDRTEIEVRARDGHPPHPTLDAAVEEARAGNPTAPESNLRHRTEWNVKETPQGLVFKWDPKVPALWEPDDLSHKLSAIAVPTLLVRGGLTNVLPRAVAEAMIAALPDGELVEVATSGHSVPTDRPQELAPLVLDWLRRRS